MAEVYGTVLQQAETRLTQLLVQAELHIWPNDNTVTVYGIVYLKPKQWTFLCGVKLVPVFPEMCWWKSQDTHVFQSNKQLVKFVFADLLLWSWVIVASEITSGNPFGECIPF